MPATHRLRVKLNAGAWQTGGVTAALGDTVALSPDNTVGVTSYRYEIFDYPPGFACPAGWSADANSVYYSTAATPPDFALDAVEWGKYALRLTVNGGVSEVIVGKSTRVQADPLLIDEETAISVPSGLGVVGLMQRETTQFGGVDWTRQVNNDLRLAASATEGTRAPVRLAATANIADLSNAGANMDGVALAVRDRVLLPWQTTQTQNGTYVVASLTPTVLSRAADMADGATLTPGLSVAVQAGAAWQGSTWTLQGDGSLAVGTDALDFRVGLGDGATIAAATIQCIGDSNTANSEGWRAPMVACLRQYRDDFDLIGTVADAPTALASGAWFHDAVSGYTMADVESDYATWDVETPFGATPDVVVDMIGTNNIVVSGHSAAQMIAARATMDAEIDATSPGALRVAIAVPPFVAGSIPGGNLAAWNAIVVAYNALLSAYCDGKPRYFYCDATSSLAAGDIGPDGVHLTDAGRAAVGKAVAEYLDRVVLRLRRGLRTTTFRSRAPQGSVHITGIADSATATSDPAFRPTDSYAVAFDFHPEVVNATGNYEVAQYGTFGNANYWGIFQNAAGLRVYGATGAAHIVAGPASTCLAQGATHRVLMVCHANGADSAIGLYVNGALVGLAIGVADWTAMTQQTTVFGLGPQAVGHPGFFLGRVQAWKGAGIPRPGTLAAQRAAEQDYYLGASPFASACVANKPLDTDLADLVTGGVSITLGGSAALASPAPRGTPRRPWETLPVDDPPFVAQDISGNVLHLRADTVELSGSGISVWLDRSGAGNNFIQGTVANQPRYRLGLAAYGGQPIVHGDDTSDHVAHATNVSLATNAAATLFLVLKQGSDVNNWLLINAASSSGVISRFSGALIEWYAGGGADRYTIANGPSGLNIIAIRQTDGVAWQAWVNGRSTGAPVVPTVALSNIKAIMGRDTGTNGSAGNDWAEVIAYNRALTDAEMAAVWRGLGKRYGIAVT